MKVKVLRQMRQQGAEQSSKRHQQLKILLVSLSCCLPLSGFAQSMHQQATDTSREATSVETNLNADTELKISYVPAQNIQNIGDVIQHLRQVSVIYVGEIHNDYADHLMQLALIKGLQAEQLPLAIGMEMFPRNAQSSLDDYIAGRLSENEMLEQSHYFEHWHYDYRLYRPILRFAKEHQIPVIALNLPEPLAEQIQRVGVDGLNAEDKKQLPEFMVPASDRYQQRLAQVFAQHPATLRKDLNSFVRRQLLWDEYMANVGAEYLRAHPKRTLVMLTGGGHVEYGDGIPVRFKARLDVPAAILLSGQNQDLATERADYFVFPEPRTLPAMGKLGIAFSISQEPHPHIRVDSVMPESGAAEAGIKPGDELIALNGQTISSYSTLRIALMDMLVGERVQVRIKRQAPQSEGDAKSQAQELDKQVILQ